MPSFGRNLAPLIVYNAIPVGYATPAGVIAKFIIDSNCTMHMKPMKKLILAVTAMQCLTVTTAQATAPDDEVLFALTGAHPIVAGRFSAVAEFQKGLLTAAKACKLDIAKPEVFADGVIGKGTVGVIKKIAMCEMFKGDLGTPPAAQGLVTAKLWRLVAPNTPVPDALARSFIMSRGAEATDYPDIEFNTASDGGIITWGPQGATVGQAHQVQQIISAIDKELPGLIERAFGGETAAIRQLALTYNDANAAKVVREVSAAQGRVTAWHAGFRALGNDARVRAIYDRVMVEASKSGISEAVRDFYRSYWANGWCPSEADLGFFVDRAVQITVYQEDTDQAAQDVLEVEAKHGKSFSSAQRRRAIAANFWARKEIWVGDRLARDVAYYIDGIPRQELTDERLLALVAKRGAAKRKTPDLLKDEFGAWAIRLGVSAAAYGLTDRPASVPFGLSGEPSACAASRVTLAR